MKKVCVNTKMNFRIREITYGVKNIKYTGVYVIDELVTSTVAINKIEELLDLPRSGFYITWENRFNNKESAEQYLNKWLERNK